MWVEQNEMESNEREVQNPAVAKGLDAGKGTKKWRKILVIAEGKMSLSRDAES